MSLLKNLLDKLQEIDTGIHSNEVFRDKDGKLLPHPTASSTDPVSQKDFDSRHEFETDVKKKVKGK